MLASCGSGSTRTMGGYTFYDERMPGEREPGYTGPTGPKVPLTAPPAGPVGAPPELPSPWDVVPYLAPAFNVVDALISMPVGNGTEAGWTVPAGVIAMLQATFFNFVADATVGTRDVGLTWRRPDGTKIGEYVINVAVYIANANVETFGAVDNTNFTKSGLVHFQLPRVAVQEGGSINVETGGTGGAADHFTNGPKFSLMVWPRPADYLPPLPDRDTEHRHRRN